MNIIKCVPVLKHKITLRQFLTVVSVLLLLLSVFITAYKQEAHKKRLEELKNAEIITFEKDNFPDAGFKLYIDEIEIIIEKQKEKEKTEYNKDQTKEIRENKIYYVIDEGYRFYLEEEYQDYVYEKLKENNRKDLYEIIIALMYHESKFEKDKVSSTHDHGLMQVNEGNYKNLHKTLGINSLDDPYENIDAGIYLFMYAIDKYNDLETALVCYNQGDKLLKTGNTYSTEYSQGVLNDINKLKEVEDDYRMQAKQY